MTKVRHSARRIRIASLVIGVSVAMLGAACTETELVEDTSATQAPILEPTLEPTSQPAVEEPEPTFAPQPNQPPPMAQSCHPSYTGACLKPDSPDYDCAGGSGNGPDYTGPVNVVGPDQYDLDRDGDGLGCE